MASFPDALKTLVDRSSSSTSELSAAAGLSRNNFVHLMAGRREVGPKALAGIFKAFPNRADQRLLLEGYMAKAVNEINGHIQNPKSRWTINEVFPIQAARAEAGPLWLTQLVDEAVEEGSSDEKLLPLVRALIESVLEYKRSSAPKTKR